MGAWTGSSLGLAPPQDAIDVARRKSKEIDPSAMNIEKSVRISDQTAVGRPTLLGDDGFEISHAVNRCIYGFQAEGGSSASRGGLPRRSAPRTVTSV